MANIEELLVKRQAIIEKEKQTYLTLANQLNSECKNVLNINFGTELVKNSLFDVSGEIVRRYFVPDVGKMYITADQLLKRIVSFNYDNEYDPLGNNTEFQKNVYNYYDASGSLDLQGIRDYVGNSQTKLFLKEKTPSGKHKKYVDEALFQKSKKEYLRDLKETNPEHKIRGTYTGQVVKYNPDKRGVNQPDHQVDHSDPRASETVEDFLEQSTIDDLKCLYNSPTNFAVLGINANQVKGDTRVFKNNKTGKVVYAKSDKEKKSFLNDKENFRDITYKATPEQKVQAEIVIMENASADRIEKLKAEGMLDENGKVPKAVKKGMIQKKYEIANAESIVKLKAKEVHGEAGKKAVSNTKKNFKKIVVGQVLYYLLPPVIYESKIILSKTDNIDKFMDKLSASGERIIKYVVSKRKAIGVNLATNTLKEFVKNFFDFLLEIVKATVKRMVKMIKSITLSLIDSAKVIANPNATASEKADSVVNIMAVSITTCLIEVLGEYIESTFGISNIISEPVQMIATIVCTNVVMLVLQKADIFNVRHGIKIAKLNAMYEEIQQQYDNQVSDIKSGRIKDVDEIMVSIEKEIAEISLSLSEIDLFKEDVTNNLAISNELFQMNIDFEKEWNEYLLFS